MNRTRLTAWLAGLLLALSASAAAADGPPLAPASSRCRCADAPKVQYYAYGQSFTRVGDLWVYLGAYDDADAAAKAGKDGGYSGVKVVSGAALELPPADGKVTFKLIRVTPRIMQDAGSYKTAKEAAAAAAKILADGDKFEVTYNQFSN
jgi:hypothetical protein